MEPEISNLERRNVLARFLRLVTLNNCFLPSRPLECRIFLYSRAEILSDNFMLGEKIFLE